MAYWYRYKKTRSFKNIVKDRLIENKDIIIKQKNFEKLNIDELKNQKYLYEKQLKEIEKIYSVDQFKNNLKKINLIRKKIEKKLIINEVKLKKISRNLKTKTKYYIENKNFFAAKKVVSSIILHKSYIQEIFKIENDNYNLINGKDFQELLQYFQFLNKIIFEYYHLYKIEIFDDNSMSWDHQVLNNKVFINPYSFIKKYNLTFDNYIFEKFNELRRTDKVLYIEDRFVEGDDDASYSLRTANFTKNFDWIEYDKFVHNKDSWGHTYERINDTDYSKSLLNNKKMREIHETLKTFRYYNNKLFSNQNLYKKFYTNCTDVLKRYLRKLELLIRANLLKSEKQSNQGKIYIMKNEGFPGMYKIGSTYGSVGKRAEELSGTNTPYPWLPEYHIKLQDAEYYEKQIHKLLKDYRFRKDREFFECDVNKIKKCLNEVSKISNKGKNKVSSNMIKKNVNL